MIYVILFYNFFILNGLFINLRKETQYISQKYRIFQLIIIVIFLFGGDRVFKTKPDSCYDDPYITIGKVDYYMEEPFIRFIDCYGHNSRSQFISKLKGNTKGDSIKIYYNYNTRNYYKDIDTNLYRVFIDKNEYKTVQKKPIRFYSEILMLFIFMYTYIVAHRYSLISSNLFYKDAKIYYYSQDKSYFKKLIDHMGKQNFENIKKSFYFYNPIVKTDKEGRIVVERFKLFHFLFPAIIALFIFLFVYDIKFNTDNNLYLSNKEKVLLYFIT